MRGFPRPDKISTSYVERQNLTMRMGMRRFTRLTKTLGRGVTPAMAAGVADHKWSLRDIAALLD